MTRAIIAPPLLDPAALDELKTWLGITTSRDDAALGQLLRAGLDLFEAFTGTIALTTTCEDRFAPGAGWYILSARPVPAITEVAAISAAGSRVLLPTGDYVIDLDADGAGRVRLLRAPVDPSVVVRFTAGLAAEWDLLPAAIRHGLIRLAAHEYRQREGGPAGALPVAVAALWRPFRRVRL